jgi:hypothetical protein
MPWQREKHEERKRREITGVRRVKSEFAPAIVFANGVLGVMQFFLKFFRV